MFEKWLSVTAMADGGEQMRSAHARDVSLGARISCHKLGQNDDFVSKYPSSAAAILKLRFRDHVTPIFQPVPISDPGP